jgi:hypothetical protein
MGKTGAIGSAKKAASRAAANAASRPKTIAEKGGKGRVREPVGSDSDTDERDELEDDASSSSSSVIARKQHAACISVCTTAG